MVGMVAMRMLNPATAAAAVSPVAPAPARRAARDDEARWQDALAITAALWSFVMLVYLPVIAEAHSGEGPGSIALDCSTFLLSAGLALLLFAVFRASAGVPPVARLVLMTGAVLGLAMFQAAFDLMFTGLVAAHVDAAWRHLPTDLRRGYGAALRYANVFAVNAVLFQLVASRRRALKQERRLAEVVATRQRAELGWLRLKLNPHFLFNTLNSISGLVVTGRAAEAERGIEQLSAFLRASLDGDPGAHNTVEEELALVDQYLGIEEMRFGDRLRAELHCSDTAAPMVLPALTVQPLVELAVRDGVGPSPRPVHLRVSAEVRDAMLEVEVRDDAPRAGDDELAALLDEMRRRLTALHGTAELSASSDARGTAVLVRMRASAAR